MKHLCLALLVACSSPSGIDITAPEKAPADSGAGILLVAKPSFRGAPIEDGTEVRFRTDLGSFSQIDATLLDFVSETAGGEARATLYPPNTPGEVTVTVSFQNPNAQPVSQTVKIKLEQISPADAQQVSLGCESTAIGALMSNAPTLSIKCSLILKNKQGASLSGGVVKFYAEAGQVSDGGGQADGTRAFTYRVAPGSKPPQDVFPHPMELSPNPGDSEQYLVTMANGREMNPRDGVATVLAVIRAHEAFEDIDNNGKYDDGVDTFTDEAEPFIDVDDDGIFDPQAGDKFLAPAFDANGNGIWDQANGVYDADTLIGRSIHILWTGEPRFVSRPLNPPPLPPGGTKTINVFLTDDNGNPPAGYDADDQVQLSVSGGTALVQVTGLVTSPLNANIGMIFEDMVFKDFVRDASSRFPVLRRFPINIRDDRQNKTSPVALTIEGDLAFSPFPADQSDVRRTIMLTPIPLTVNGTGR